MIENMNEHFKWIFINCNFWSTGNVFVIRASTSNGGKHSEERHSDFEWIYLDIEIHVIYGFWSVVWSKKLLHFAVGI